MDSLVFSLGRVLGSWAALRVAVEHGFGGVQSSEKMKWLPEAVGQILRENDNLDQIEIEDYLTQLTYEEFDVVIEDGSLRQMSVDIHTLFSMWTRGAHRELMSWLQAKFPDEILQASVSVQHSKADEVTSLSSSDENEEEPMDCQISSNKEEERATPSGGGGDDDGWQVVRGRRKKKA